MIHLVDAASVEGRDPIEDIIAINKELEAYNPELAKRPQVIAANKMDAMPEEDREVIIEMLEEAMNTANSTIPDETPEWEENEDELARICGLR